MWLPISPPHALKCCKIQTRDFFHSGIRSQSPVIFRSRLFDEIFSYVLLSALTGDDNDVDVAFEKIVPKFTNEKSFDSKLFYEHVSTKLRLGVLRLKHPRLTSAEARSVLLPLLHRYPSNPVLLDTLLTKTDLRPSVADQLWRKSVQVFFF